MQVSIIPGSKPTRPQSDAEKLQVQVNFMREYLQNYNLENTDYTPLLETIIASNELVHHMDNANDFYKIGGFDLLPSLLDFPQGEVRAATAELIADLVQNNSFCQSKFLDTDLAAQLVQLLKYDQDSAVCVKSLYALSCFCRSNHEAIHYLQQLDGLPVLVQAVQSPVEKLRTKAAFLLSHLVVFEPPIMDALFDAGFVEKLAELIMEGRNASHEHLLSILLTLVQQHEPSRVLMSSMRSMQRALNEHLKFYDGKEEYEESKEYTLEVLKVCFSE